MTDPVILTDCPTCEARTAHSRDQSAAADPPAVETDLICSECGTVRTTKEVYEAAQDDARRDE
jgi:transcriptional regulator NrdR family protein